LVPSNATSANRPQSIRNGDRIDPAPFPPSHFISNLVVLPVVGPAQRDHEFVAVFAPHCSRLGKAEVVRIRRVAAAQQAQL